MRKVSMISALAILAMIGVVVNEPAASAQSKTCPLILNISTMDQEGQAQPVKNARAYVVRKNTRARIPAVLVSGNPQFSRLRAGHYKLTILKRGYTTTTQDVDFDCTAMNSKTDLQVSLEPTAGFPKSVSSAPMGIPPVRRGVTTIIGTGTPGESNEARNEPGLAAPSGSISGGVLNGRAIVLPKPAYPPIARAAHASGTVVVQVIIDEEGNVISARAVSGHPLLQAVCVAAARGAKFSPTKLAGQPVKVTGVIAYNFVAQ
jgi:TonB family protein